jgi:type I restriction enzyme S subunit
MSEDYSLGFNSYLHPLEEFLEIIKERREGPLPIYSVTLRDGMQRRDGLGRIIQSNLNNEDNLFAAKNDICYNMMRMWQGASGIAPEDCLVSPAYVVCRPKEDLHPCFAAHLLKSEQAKKSFIDRSQGVTSDRWRLYPEEFLKIRLPIPPLPEQKKIAEILSGIDKTLERTKRRTTTLEALEIATRDELFENLAKESHSERKLSEIALAPITYGIVQPGDYDPNGIILVRGQDYLQGWGKKEFFKVSPELSDKYRRSLIQPKDVLICIAGASTGDSSITPKWISNANITQTTARVRVDTNIISPEFFLEFTKSRVGRERLMNYVRGSAQPGLNLSDIEKIVIPIPGNDQQQQISNSLDSLKKLVLSSRNKEDYLKQIKKGLSSDLLSGRKRVSV